MDLLASTAHRRARYRRHKRRRLSRRLRRQRGDVVPTRLGLLRQEGRPGHLARLVVGAAGLGHRFMPGRRRRRRRRGRGNVQPGAESDGPSPPRLYILEFGLGPRRDGRMALERPGRLQRHLPGRRRRRRLHAGQGREAAGRRLEASILPQARAAFENRRRATRRPAAQRGVRPRPLRRLGFVLQAAAPGRDGRSRLHLFQKARPGGREVGKLRHVRVLQHHRDAEHDARLDLRQPRQNRPRRHLLRLRPRRRPGPLRRRQQRLPPHLRQRRRQARHDAGVDVGRPGPRQRGGHRRL